MLQYINKKGMTTMSEELNRATGALHDVGELRIYDYETVCASSNGNVDYPSVFKISRPYEMRCKDQGNVGACVAEVIAQVSEAYFGTEMSEGQIYAVFRPNPESGGFGMSTESAIKQWISKSTVPLHVFDYLWEMPELYSKLKEIPELDTLYTQYKIKGYVDLSYASIEKKDRCIKEALTGAANKYGLIAVCPEGFGESHCIWLTGWDDENDTYFVKNSWGNGWGINGDGTGTVRKKKVGHVYMVLFEEPKLPFTDVKESDWFFEDVKHMYLAGHMKGTSGNTFEPDKPLTRAEAAALFNRITSFIDKKFAVINNVLNIKIEDNK